MSRLNPFRKECASRQDEDLCSDAEAAIYSMLVSRCGLGHRQALTVIVEMLRDREPLGTLLDLAPRP